MKEIIKIAFKNKSIISFCLDEVDWEKRIIGYVKSVKYDIATIEIVDIYGSCVKFKKILIDRIAVIEINDSYNKHLESLRYIGNSIKKTRTCYYFNKGISFNKKVERLCQSGNVCTIFFGTEYLTGVLIKINETTLFINSFGFRGTKEGESFCKLQNITKIRYQGPLEAKITYLQNIKL